MFSPPQPDYVFFFKCLVCYLFTYDDSDEQKLSSASPVSSSDSYENVLALFLSRVLHRGFGFESFLYLTSTWVQKFTCLCNSLGWWLSNSFIGRCLQ